MRETEELGAQELNSEVELQKIRKELLHFASLINHDFKEPVRTISAFSTLLKKRVEADDKKSQELLFFIEDGAKRMNGMIDGLVEYLRADQYLEPPFALDYSRIFMEVLEKEKKLVAEKKAIIQLPNTFITCVGASSAIKTVIKHILQNALYFQEPNAIPHIRISTEQNSRLVFLHFDDNGIGVPEDKLDQIFEPFRRLNAIGAYKGCGLGLATSQKIMHANKGFLSASRLESGGTRITMALPANLS